MKMVLCRDTIYVYNKPSRRLSPWYTRDRKKVRVRIFGKLASLIHFSFYPNEGR